MRRAAPATRQPRARSGRSGHCGQCLPAPLSMQSISSTPSILPPPSGLSTGWPARSGGSRRRLSSAAASRLPALMRAHLPEPCTHLAAFGGRHSAHSSPARAAHPPLAAAGRGAPCPGANTPPLTRHKDARGDGAWPVVHKPRLHRRKVGGGRVEGVPSRAVPAPHAGLGPRRACLGGARVCALRARLPLPLFRRLRGCPQGGPRVPAAHAAG